LFALLAILAVFLTIPTHDGGAISPSASVSTPSQSPTSQANVRSARYASFPQRLALPLALLSLVVCTALLGTLVLRPPRIGDTRAPFRTVRTEFGALSKLAETSLAQNEALDRERGGRQRAEEDAQLNRELLYRSLQEKIRLGQDLHDGIIQSLYAAGLTIESARAVAQTNPEEADRRLVQGRETLNKTIRQIRDYIGGLTSEGVPQSYAQGVAELLTVFDTGRIQFDVNIDDDAAATLSPAQVTEALHITREAISNSCRHGAASRISVQLSSENAAVKLTVRDDGSGFDPGRQNSTGHGLRNMQARAERLGGTLRLESQPGAGTVVTLLFPTASTGPA
jgi:signal transduction histidine kinase